MPDKPTPQGPAPQGPAPNAREAERDRDLEAAERDEAQTLRQAPDNAGPGEAAGG